MSWIADMSHAVEGLSKYNHEEIDLNSLRTDLNRSIEILLFFQLETSNASQMFQIVFIKSKTNIITISKSFNINTSINIPYRRDHYSESYELVT